MDEAKVYEIDDGGMGSLRFVSREQSASFSHSVVECEYIDADGVGVNISINLDRSGFLFELDIWKYDFSNLIKFPDPKELQSISYHLDN
ncbi:hypothetical protein [Chelatococcus sp. GW1]|uniref:DUF6984 family protein n=1 Tax=Chelatococcus sp. GW1 TaxID=1211115 RepID=UPI0035292CE9